MNFFIDHSGFFLGVGVIMLLALIGYYADKRDSAKTKKNNNDVKPTNNGYISNKNDNSGITEKNNKFINDFNYNLVDDKSNSVVDNTDLVDGKSNSVDSFTQNIIPNSFESNSMVDSPISPSYDTNISDISGNHNLNSNVIDGVDDKFDMNSSSGVVSGDVSNLSSDISSFTVSDFEDISMSLDDLEKKKYEDIANKSSSFDDSENYYYSNLDDSESTGSNIMSEVDNKDGSIDSNELKSLQVSEGNLNVNNSENLDALSDNVDLNINPVEFVDNLNMDMVQEPVVEVSDNLEKNLINNSNIDSISNTDTEKLFVSESEDDNHGHLFDSEISTDDKSNSFENNGVPELFSTDSSEASSNDEVSSENNFVTDSSIFDPSNDSSEDIWKF